MTSYQDPEWKARMRIVADFNRARSERVGVGKGVSKVDLDAISPRVATMLNDLAFRRSRGDIGFADLPYRQEPVRAVENIAAHIRERFDTLVWFGIGGSSLGGQTLVEALAPPFQELLEKDRRRGPRVLFCDNVDPDRFGALMDLVDPKSTAFAVATKSGGTAETMVQFWYLRHRLISTLGESGYRERVFAVTDPENGRLCQVSREDGLQMLDIPPAVGGRYSALTSVGLLPAAVAGIDPRELLAGAAAMDQRCREPDLWQNPAAAFAAFTYLMDTLRHRPIVVVWPYADGLRRFGNWFVQLWAESLGKKVNLEGKVVSSGATPVPAVGVCDQHAQNQLFMEGPEDKFIVFVRVREFGREVVLPTMADRTDQEDVSYLSGKRMNDLLDAEYLATAVSLADAGRPSCTLELPQVNAFTIGALIHLVECACVMAGGLYRVNPFDQPGVEAGKRLAFALMGRLGFGELASQVTREDPGEDRFRI